MLNNQKKKKCKYYHNFFYKYYPIIKGLLKKIYYLTNKISKVQLLPHSSKKIYKKSTNAARILKKLKIILQRFLKKLLL